MYYLCRLLLLVATTALISVAIPTYAQSQGSDPHYCVSGTAAFTLAATEKEYAVLEQKCRPGDIIAIPSGEVAVIAKTCDFSKTIVFAGGRVICALTKTKPQR